MKLQRGQEGVVGGLVHEGVQFGGVRDLDLGEPAVGFAPEHFPPRPSVWAADDASATRGQWIDATLEPHVLVEALDGRDIYDTIGFGNFTIWPDEKPEVISAIA